MPLRRSLKSCNSSDHVKIAIQYQIQINTTIFSYHYYCITSSPAIDDCHHQVSTPLKASSFATQDRLMSILSSPIFVCLLRPIRTVYDSQTITCHCWLVMQQCLLVVLSSSMYLSIFIQLQLDLSNRPFSLLIPEEIPKPRLHPLRLQPARPYEAANCSNLHYPS